MSKVLKSLFFKLLYSLLIAGLYFSCEPDEVNSTIEDDTSSTTLSETDEMQRVVYGPEKFVRETGAPTTYQVSIDTSSFECVTPPYVLTLINGDEEGNNRVSSAWVELDGVDVFGPSDFNKQVASLEANVELTAESTISIRIAGGPGTFFYLMISGQKIITEAEPVMDIEGNIYQTVRIGTQIWLAENLRTGTFNDSTEILNIVDSLEWRNTVSPAYSWYDNDSTYKPTLGAMYNWYAVGTGKLCPKGWHVPTDEEFKILEAYLGMPEDELDLIDHRGTDQGTQLKSTTGWILPEGNGTDAVGYNGLPSGQRYNDDGLFYSLGINAHIWVNTEMTDNTAWYRVLIDDKSTILRNNSANKANGFCVRCIQDEVCN